MFNYTSTNQPWQEYIKDIEHIEVSEGIESIGKYSFYKHENLTSIQIPSTVKKIYFYAFGLCSSLNSNCNGFCFTRI